MMLKQKLCKDQSLKFEGIDKDPRLSEKGDRFYNNLAAWSMFKLAYY